MTDFVVQPLDPSTGTDFAALVERHNGVWGGCWCLAFHPEGKQQTPDGVASRERPASDDLSIEVRSRRFIPCDLQSVAPG